MNPWCKPPPGIKNSSCHEGHDTGGGRGAPDAAADRHYAQAAAESGRQELDRLRAAGFCDLIINTAYLGGQIEQALGNGVALGVRIQYSAETTPLETGGALHRARRLLGEEPFVLINGDIWIDYPLRNLSRVALPERGAHLILNPTQTLRVRAYAPLEERVRYVARKEGLSLSAARRKVQTVDAERSAFYQRHFKNQVESPLNFDLMLNTGSLSVDECVEVVTLAFKRRFSGPAD